MKKILTTLLFTTLFMTLFASIDININVETPILRGGSFSKELPLLMKVGEPKIPYVKAKVLLPQGEIITETKVVFTELTNYRRDLEVEYTKQQQPTSVREIIATERNEAIYTSNKAYPHTDYELLGIQKMNGYSFAIYNIYPYKYNPITKSFDYYNNIELSLETESNSKSLEESASKVIDSEIVFKKLNYDFYNIEARSSYKYSYSGTTRNIDLSTPYQMLIITNQNSSELFTEYVNWKIDNGIPTKLVTVEDIYTYYTGDNEPDIIRNFISDAYSSWAGSSIPLEYVLLGGDDEIIPIRGVWGNVGSYEDNTIPCDTYYGSLDGNWNANNNNVYGEQNDDVDYYPEISVGRIPAETPAEFNNFFNKTYHYVNNNTYSNNIATMFGENLNNNPVTWGGDYKDEIVERMPTDYLMNTHYQRDGNFSTPEVVGAINGGSGIMNHMGHANENTVCGLNGSVINNMLTNDERAVILLHLIMLQVVEQQELMKLLQNNL
ncbi:MAG: hypothetical protein B6226_01555 [Candidatus Cloacimonetes bacterium 4572_65]|nr:MAG: hypothetical protein B6226_01555 [Candidatus Cloacimonetes bacterium 4572_65]